MNTSSIGTIILLTKYENFLDNLSCELKSHQSLHNSLRISLILIGEIYTYLIGIFSSHFAFHIHLIYKMKVLYSSKYIDLKVWVQHNFEISKL